ncbi:MAG: prepilin peptidase [Pseudomonadota bacterium]
MIAILIPYAVAATLIAATMIDMRTGKIPNWLSYIFIGLFGVLVLVSPDKDTLAWQFGFALAAFALGLVLYALLGFGAGAVKLLFGAALFLPMEHPIKIVGLLLLTLFLGGLFVNLVRVKFGSDDSGWKVLRERVMPMSLPVAATSLIGIFWL